VVNFEVKASKPFPHLVFLQFTDLKATPKILSFDGELMTACLRRESSDLSSSGFLRAISINSNAVPFSRNFKGLFVGKLNLAKW